MFRHFKHHYHLVKRAYKEMAENGNLSFRFHYSNENLSFSTNLPEKERTLRFLALVRNFLDVRDKLFYKKTLNLLKSDFSKEVSVNTFLRLDREILRLETGDFKIEIYGKLYKPINIFNLLSKAGFFESNEKAREHLAALYKIPITEHLFWNQFLDYTIKAFQIISEIFSLVLEIEKTEKFQSLFESREPKFNKCVYCLSETGTFTAEEHFIPETLCGDEFYLPKGFVCDDCNNGILSQLDNSLLKHQPIAYLNVCYSPYTKAGKFPRANFQNMLVEKIEPNNIRHTIKDKTGKIKNEKKLEDGRQKFELTMNGKRIDPKLLARAIYKMGLGTIANDLGHDTALDSKYKPARDFILNGNDFKNNMIVSGKFNPNPNIEFYLDTQYGGTFFYISIFGCVFMINLEENPVLQNNPENSNEEIKSALKQFKFEFISLLSTRQ